MSTACDQPSGTVVDGTDCDDSDSAINPAATEVCDELDNDCDGDVDDDDSGLDTTTASTWYADDDGDEYGDASSTILACYQPSGYVTDNTDCDDTDESVNPGALDLVDGADNDCDGTIDDFTLSDVDAAIIGDPAYGQACLTAAPAGDVDGDGADDLIVGSYDASAWLILGPVTSDVDLASDALPLLVSGKAHAVTAGDLDDDGYSDILVGNGLDSSYTGVIHVVFGSPSMTASGYDLTTDSDLEIVGDTTQAYLPTVIDASSDLTGDGINDLLIGREIGTYGTFEGGADIVPGPLSASSTQVTLSTARSTTFTGSSYMDHMGISIAAGGDVDGDGYNDAVLGSYNADSSYTDAGSAYIAFGPITDASVDIATDCHELSGALEGEKAGSDVAILGDTNLDGYDDLLIGAFYSNSDAGRAYLVLGPATTISNLASADAIIEGDDSDDHAAGTSAMGDLDEDGAADFAVRSIDDECGGSTRGAYYLFFGAVTGTVYASDADAVVCGENDGDQLGSGSHRNIGYGDLDQDGVQDIGISSRSAEGTGMIWLLQPESW